MNRLEQRSPKPVALFGLFGVPNYGNQASLDTVVTRIRAERPEVDLAFVCAAPEDVGQQYGGVAESLFNPGVARRVVPKHRIARIAAAPIVEVARWIGTFQATRRFQAIVVPGTGLLDDFGLRPFQLPYILFRWGLAARLTRTPITLISIGAGPIDNPVSRRFMISFARHAFPRTYRDQSSAQFMATVGVPGAITPDVVFGTSTDSIRTGSRDRCVVGLGVMAYYGWGNDPAAGAATFDRYLQGVVEVARQLLAKDFDIRLVIGESSDRVAVECVLARLGDTAGRVVSEPTDSFDDVLAQTVLTDAVIATRYHCLVAALVARRPVVSIEYASKSSDLMRTFGLGDLCHQVEQFDPTSVVDDVVRESMDWDRGRDEIDATLIQWQDRVQLTVNAAFDAVSQ